ncbi:hypothetical protein G3I19_01610 [Streptomyces sp. SID10853]|uniref:U32 family peptidase n=1 Tax=Streptomyces sp. SID10853 TaxID=2706028 RepID=UPI0013C127E8|nr:U32 family peptidase [Streptomyces sp. SID10853]NDZ77243.1 hypothetical protein [Streptomyces sp. SID10853]
MDNTRSFLRQRGLLLSDDVTLPASEVRFPDGGQYRVEIPSVEGPDVMAAVIEEAQRRGVPLHRLSQGSGGLLTTQGELADLAGMGAAHSVEVSLFVRPLAGWGIGAGALAPLGTSAAQARGADQLVHNLEDLRRMTDAGLRGALITDLGVLEAAALMRSEGELPPRVRFKGSVQMGLSNPVSIGMGARCGLDSYNVPPDLTVAHLAEIRARTDMPLDIYIESPDDVGGFVRYYEIAEIVRVAAPVYLKFGVRNAPGLYPSGAHLRDTAVALGRERVRRADIGLEFLRRYYPDAVASAPGAPDLGIPEISERAVVA